jgi:hypothetical protein
MISPTSRRAALVAALFVATAACSDSRTAQPNSPTSAQSSTPRAETPARAAASGVASSPTAPSASATVTPAAVGGEPTGLPAVELTAADRTHLIYKPTKKASSKNKGTLSLWYKVKSDTGDYQHLFSARNWDARQAQQIWIYKGKVSLLSRERADDGYWIETKSTEWGEPGKWHHLLAHFDLEKKSAADALHLWIDGAEPPTDIRANNVHSEFALFREAEGHYVGITGDVEPFDGWLADFHALDGRLEPVSSFFNDGKAVAYRGDHGTNGFALTFGDPKNLGRDAANGNDFKNEGVRAVPVSKK